MYKLIFVLGLWMVVSPDVWEDPKVYKSREFVLSFGLELGKTGVIAEDTIQTGILISNGRYIKPPYRLLLKNDSIFVNGSLLSTWNPEEKIRKERKKRDEEYLKKYKGTPLEDRYKFMQALDQKYFELVCKGIKGKELLEKIEEFVKTQKIVKIRKWSINEGWIYLYFDFTYREAYPEWKDKEWADNYVEMGYSFSPEHPIPCTKEDTVYEKRSALFSAYANIRCNLKRNDVHWVEDSLWWASNLTSSLFVSTYYGRNKIYKLRDVILGSGTDDEKIRKMSKLLSVGDTMLLRRILNRINENIETWRELK